MKRLAPKDVTGKCLNVWDIVRVIGIPDLNGMSRDCRAESLPVFRHLVATYKRIVEFDEFGMAWLRFKIRKGSHAGFHSVGIEPYLLRLRRRVTRSRK